MHCQPESFCASASEILEIAPNSLESFWRDSNVSRHVGEFLDGLKNFWSAWIVFGQSQLVLNSLRSFRMVWKVCSHLGGVYFTVGCQVQYRNEHKNNALDFAPDQFTMHMLFTKNIANKIYALYP